MDSKSIEKFAEIYLEAAKKLTKKERQKAVSKGLMKGKTHPWKACMTKMKGKVKTPEAFCAKMKDVHEGGTDWRGPSTKKKVGIKTAEFSDEFGYDPQVWSQAQSTMATLEDTVRATMENQGIAGDAVGLIVGPSDEVEYINGLNGSQHIAGPQTGSNMPYGLLNVYTANVVDGLYDYVADLIRKTNPNFPIRLFFNKK